MMFPTDEGGTDDPECPSGAVAIMLDVLQSIPAYKTGMTKVETAQALKQLLEEKLNREYTPPKGENVNLQLEETRLNNFKKKVKTHLTCYAHSLFLSQQQRLKMSTKD